MPQTLDAAAIGRVFIAGHGGGHCLIAAVPPYAILTVNGESRSRGSPRVGEASVKLYRINKLAKAGGVIVKKRDVLASSDREAVQRAAESADCPVCEVLHDGRSVGAIT